MLVAGLMALCCLKVLHACPLCATSCAGSAVPSRPLFPSFKPDLTLVNLRMPPPLPRSRYPLQQFNAVANQATSSLLFLSCIGIIIPTVREQINTCLYYAIESLPCEQQGCQAPAAASRAACLLACLPALCCIPLLATGGAVRSFAGDDSLA